MVKVYLLADGTFMRRAGRGVGRAGGGMNHSEEDIGHHWFQTSASRFDVLVIQEQSRYHEV